MPDVGGADGGAAGIGGSRSVGGAAGNTTDPGDTTDAGNTADAGASGSFETGSDSDAARDGDADGPVDADDDGVSTTCPATTDLGAATPGSACAIAPFALDPAAVCGAGNPCPVRGARRITCPGFGYGPWLVASGEAGASILFDNGAATSEFGLENHLFTLGADPAADRLEDIPALTSAMSALSIESSGRRAIFSGERPGAWRVRESDGGWFSEEATMTPPSDLAMVQAGRSIDGTHAFTAYFNLGDTLPRLGERQGECWQSRLLANEPADSMAMDVDALNRPWVAWRPAGTGQPALRLAAPDGTISTPFLGTDVGDISQGLWSPPSVLADGLTGTDPAPALAFQGDSGLHVLTFDASTARWVDQVVPGSTFSAVTSDCPPENVSPDDEVAPCNGLTTCSIHELPGALGGFGLARTARGRAYVAWLESKADSSYALAPGPRGECVETRTSAATRVNLVVARVTGGLTQPEAIVRFQLATSDLLLDLPFIRSVVMTAREDTLLVVATLTGNPVDLRYLEIDTSALP